MDRTEKVVEYEAARSVSVVSFEGRVGARFRFGWHVSLEAYDGGDPLSYAEGHVWGNNLLEARSAASERAEKAERLFALFEGFRALKEEDR